MNSILFEKVSFADQVRTMRACRLLVGNHGAGLTNMIFMPTGSRVIEIVQSFKPCFEILAHIMGHDYQRVYADRSRIGGFSVNKSALVSKLKKNQ